MLLVKLEFKDQVANKESKELQELLDPLDHWEPQDHKVLMVKQVWLDQLEKVVMREQLDHQEQQDKLDNEEQQVDQETEVSQDIPESRDIQDQLDSKDQEGRKEPR